LGGVEIFFFVNTSRPHSGPTNPLPKITCGFFTGYKATGMWSWQHTSM